MKLLRLFVLPAIFSVAAIAPAYAGAGASNGWEDMGASESTCVEMAKQSLRTTGHSNVASSGQSAFGNDGAYNSVVRCVPAKNMAFFFIYGPNTEVTDSMLTDIRNRFKRMQRR